MRSFFAQKDRMIVYKFVSDYVDMIITLSTDVFGQVTVNTGTSVQPSWLAEDVHPCPDCAAANHVCAVAIVYKLC